MTAASTFALSVVLALVAGCHENTRLGTGNTGGSTTESDRRQQIGTTRITPDLSQQSPRGAR
jgi:hypothetical protein